MGNFFIPEKWEPWCIEILNPYYRPQTKFAKVMFLQVSVCPHRGVCVFLGCVHGFLGGGCMVFLGGVCGFFGGTCVVWGGRAWFFTVFSGA